MAEIDADAAHAARKRFATVQAVAARHGYELRRIVETNGRETFFVTRWGLAKEFADILAAERWVDRATGTLTP